MPATAYDWIKTIIQHRTRQAAILYNNNNSNNNNNNNNNLLNSLAVTYWIKELQYDENLIGTMYISVYVK